MKRFILFCLLIVGLTSSIKGMPPNKRVLDMIKAESIPEPAFMSDPNYFKTRNINQGLPRRLAALDNPTGSFKAIAILVKFSDQNSQVTPSYFDNLIYGTNGNTVKDFYSEVSYGRLDIITVNLPSSTGWRTMPQNYGYYVDGNYGFGNYPNNAQKLAEDAVAAADPYIDFSQYDNDGDGVVDALYIIHSGQGAEWTGSVDDIWSHAWECMFWPNVDGVMVRSYSMEPEFWSNPGDMTCGVYCHELGHVFGLPDFYDYGYDSRGLGSWSLMAFGSWNGYSGDSPAQFDAYGRVFLGFATAVNVTSNLISASIPAVEDTGLVYRLWTNGQSSTEYFLAENRQQTGFDSYLPSSGLLIYHVDDTVSTGNNNQWYPGYTSNGHYMVALEQADGAWNLEQNSNSGDAGDPYPGSTTHRTFNAASTPNSNSYNSSPTLVSIMNISNSGNIMTADLAVSNAPSAPLLISPNTGSATNNLRPLFDFANSSGANVYHLQIDNNSDFSSPIYDVSNLAVSQFTPSSNLPEALYYWRVRAGNGSAWSPWSAVWTVIIDATSPAAPINLTGNGANPSAWTNNSAFSINWTNPVDLSGIQKALYKLSNPPTGIYDTTGSFIGNPPKTLTMSIQGGVPLYLWLIDNAGNSNYNSRSQVILNFDSTRPTGCIASSADTSASMLFTVLWTRGGDNGGSGLANKFDVWVKIDNGAWSRWIYNSLDTVAEYSGQNNHRYSFEALNYDIAGNIETRNSIAETITFIDTSYAGDYLPGDANGSGAVNGLDVTYLVNFFRGIGSPPNPYLAADANGDCLVNGNDVVYLVNYFKGGAAPFRGNCR